jgi:TRAP-type C4-dicarboxylate transport system permease small subunit
MEGLGFYRRPNGWRHGGVSILLGLVFIYISLEFKSRAGVYVGGFYVIYGLSDFLPESQKVVSSLVRICALIITIYLIITSWWHVF